MAKNTHQPILRWVGGKARLTHLLLPLVPPLGSASYFEPFCGAGSLFFALKPKLATLGDLNRALADCFCRIKRDPDRVWRVLGQLKHARGQKAYYTARERFNAAPYGYQKAGLFVYLNRMSFNGIWRVNREGNFNVPYGGKKRPGFPSLAQLRTAAATLRNVTIRHGDFTATAANAQRGDFVYLDPPYPPLNGTAYFTHYTKDRFGGSAQSRVAEFFAELDKRGCLVMVSNADTPVIRRLYRGYAIREISTQRWVASHGRRYLVRDLVIRNY